MRDARVDKRAETCSVVSSICRRLGMKEVRKEARGIGGGGTGRGEIKRGAKGHMGYEQVDYPESGFVYLFWGLGRDFWRDE